MALCSCAFPSLHLTPSPPTHTQQDFYDFCIDLIDSDKTTRMRPIDRGDMQAWLGVLQTQLSAFTTVSNKGALITTLHQGWLDKKGEKVAPAEGWKRRFFVLTSRQEQLGEELEVRHYLHYYKSENHTADCSAEGGDLLPSARLPPVLTFSPHPQFPSRHSSIVLLPSSRYFACTFPPSHLVAPTCLSPTPQLPERRHKCHTTLLALSPHLPPRMCSLSCMVQE